MKIIFLDIDGVLNSKQWHESDTCKTFGNSVKRYFDPFCVELLNKIVTETQAKIIICSSWRMLKSLQELKDIFKFVGFTGKIYGMTEVLSTFEPDTPTLRGLEIQQWLKDHQKNFKTLIQYIILDDENDFLESQLKYFIQANSDIGLDASLADKAITFLK